MAKIKAKWKLTLGFIALLLCIWAFNAVSMGAVRPQALSMGVIPSNTTLGIATQSREYTNVYDAGNLTNPDADGVGAIPASHNQYNVISDIQIQVGGNIDGTLTFNIRVSHGATATKLWTSGDRCPEDLDKGKIRVWFNGVIILNADCDVSSSDQKLYTPTVSTGNLNVSSFSKIFVVAEVCWNEGNKPVAVIDWTQTCSVKYQTHSYNVSYAKAYNPTISEANYIDTDNTYYYQSGFSFSYTGTPTCIISGSTILLRPQATATVNGTTIKSGEEYKCTTEGVYDIVVKNYSSTIATYHIVVDITNPVIKAKDKDGLVLESGAYFANDVTLTVTEKNLKTVTVNGVEVAVTNGTFVVNPIDYKDEVLLIKATDMLGYYGEFELKRYVELDFNRPSIETSYKVTRWYNVKLPTARYVNITRHDYSFKTYAEALAFATAMENAHIVQKTTNGWVYSTADNMSNAQEYTDKNKMDVVIEKWADTFISEPQSYKTTGNKYYGDENGAELSDNVLSVPSSVSTISTAHYIRAEQIFVKNTFRTEHAIEQTTTARYLGDVVNGVYVDYNIVKTFTVTFDKLTWKEQLQAIDVERQGFWEITETDSLHNKTTYIVYYDVTAPNVKLTGTRGDGTIKTIDTTDYIGATQFTSVTFDGVFDNMERADNLLIELYGRNSANVVYTSLDEFPDLKSENGYYGEYTITIYDRSNNKTTFTFVVAPESLPFWTYSSLVNQTRLRITFSAGFSISSITDLHIYRVSSTGIRTRIEKDDEGKTINQLTLEYVFTVGGKYQAEITDIFGRTVITDPIFYQKGLPDGTLKGVQNGGVTNKTVTFTCLNNLITRLYYFEGSEKLEAKSEWYNQTVEGENRILTILPSVATSHRYMISLHSAVNEELFVEYEFTIDTICADVLIKDTTGKEIGYDGWTTKGFIITELEAGTRLYYYVNEYANGLGLNRYTYGTNITADGVYYFTIRDNIGNEKEFRIHVDTVVNMSISGTYTVKDGKYVARSALTFTCLETHTTFMLSKGGATYENGATLSEDGTYTLYVADSYGNVFDIEIFIDKTPPNLTLYGAKDGEITRENVSIAFEDGARGVLTNAKGEKIKDIESGELFSEDGSYFIVITDYAGNETRATFYIQTKIEITANILNEQITSDPVNVAFASDVTIKITRDGEEIAYQTRFVDVGVYEIKAVDEVGNELVFRFKIIEKLYREYEVELGEGWEIANVKKNGAPIVNTTRFVDTGDYVITITDGTVFYDLHVEIDSVPPAIEISIAGNKATFSGANKQNVSAKLFKGGEEVVGYTFGQAVNSDGTYRLELTDELGNTNVYEFVVPFQLNGWAITVIVLASVVLLLVIIFIIKSRQIKI